MNYGFISNFMERTGFPAGARQVVMELAEKLEPELTELADFFVSCYSHGDTDPMVQQLAQAQGISPYSLWMAVLVIAAETAQSRYPTEQVFYDTFSDLRCKILECHQRYGVWGTFVVHWYPRFYLGNIVKLGRMEYETRIFEGPEAISMMGMTLNPGEPLLHLHIPSSGEPFDREARLASYRQAVEYFGRPLLCVCTSWLLYPQYATLFPEDSNIADFRKDFCLLSCNEQDTFRDGWRVFGAAWDQAPELLPENNRLQRAFKKHLLDGGPFGSGVGVLIFDGQQLLTRQTD